jgi:predicted CopG family antitoxin
MAIETKQIIRGDRKTLSIQLEDLEALRRLKRGKESLAVTFHRIVEAAEMYDAILKSGEVATNE